MSVVGANDWATTAALTVELPCEEHDLSLVVAELERALREKRAEWGGNVGRLRVTVGSGSRMSNLTETEIDLLREADWHRQTEAAVERIVADRERAAVTDALAEALHPEFGAEWQEPGGVIAQAIRQARAEAWDEGKHSEHTPACRLGDVPDECTCPNPYRKEARP